MTEIIPDINQPNGREFRTVTASTKVTDQELTQLENAAAARGVRLGEWIRDVLLREAKSSSTGFGAEPLTVEIVAVQLFLTRALFIDDRPAVIAHDSRPIPRSSCGM